MKKLLLLFSLFTIHYSLFTAFAAAARAAATDPFLYDLNNVPGGDTVLGSAKSADIKIPDGTIADPAPVDMTASATPLYLNENTSFADVGGFDISGAMLGMTFAETEPLFFRQPTLYPPRKKNSIIYSVPADWKSNLDYECRQKKVVIPDELEKCINTLAKTRGLLYAAEVHLERDSTGETIDLYFTSNATGNKIWKIDYQNDADVIEGDADKFADQRDKKILVFWNEVLAKYGEPNSGSDKWISSDNSFDPMMRAYYGKLELTDLGAFATDAATNAAASRENFHSKPYAF